MELESIDWAALPNPVSPDNDDDDDPADTDPARVPALLTALRTPEPDVWNEAFPDLLHRLTPRGRNSAAAAPALPFLLELVADDGTLWKEYILRLAADVATGGDHALYLARGFTPDDAAADAGLARTHAPIAAAFDAIAGRLGSDDRDVRAAATVALGMIGGRARDAAARLRARLAVEGDQLARASELVALGVAGRALGDAGDLPLALAAMDDAELHPITRLLAATAAARLAPAGHACLPRAVDALLEGVRDAGKRADVVPWDAGHLRHHAAAILGDLAGRTGDASIVARACEVEQAIEMSPFIAECLLDGVFAGTRKRPWIAPAGARRPTAAQRLVLAELRARGALADEDDDDDRSCPDDVRPMLDGFRLPYGAALDAWLRA